MKNNRLSRLIWPSLFIFVFFIVDRIVKNLFLEKLSNYRFNFFSDLVGFAFQKNEGISYSIPLSGWLIITITLIIILTLVFFIIRVIKNNELHYYSPLTLIIFGAFSNLIDRLKYGYVIDMVIIGKWLTFNIADVMILIGAIWLIVIYLYKDNLTEHKKIDSLN